MRPRRLEIEAIGPFGQRVEVDFAQLAVDGLFLIHGPTGAGKTSLLDGVCFALYGKVPGVRGKARSDRSHHAAHGVAPRALLEFDAQGGSYVVERHAAWDAPKARGSGTTAKPAGAVLRRVDPGHEAVVAAKPTEVDAEVERLVGLTAAQFQQVILLPQGRFEKVLQANSREREELFETLFDTVDFKVATEWLEAEARRGRARVAEVRQQLAVLGDEALRRSRDVLDPANGRGARGRSTRAAGGGTALLDPPATDGAETTADLPVDGDPLDPGTLAALVTALAALVDRSRAASRDAIGAERRARSDLDGARSVADRVGSRDRLRAVASELAAAAETVDAARAQLARAEDAEALRAGLDELAHRAAVVDKAEHAIADDLATARAAVTRLPVRVDEAAALDLASMPSARELTTVCAALTTRRQVLHGLRRVAARATELRTRRDEAAALAEDRTASADRAQVRVDRFTADRPALVDAVAEAREAAGRVDDLRTRRDEAAGRAGAARELAELVPSVEAARRAFVDAREAANDAREAHLAAMERHLEGMAAHLAGRLELDRACLVCGSHDHPDPAQPADDAVSKEHVESLRTASDEAEAERDRLDEVHRRLVQDAAALRSAAGDLADDPTAADRLAREADRAHATAAALAGELVAREQRVAEVDEALAAQTARITALRSAAVEAAAARDNADDQLAETERVLGEHLDEGVDLDDAVAAVDDARAAVERVADHAADGLEAAAKLRAAHERVDAEVAASPFVDSAAARAALVDVDRRRELADGVATHDRRVAEVTAQLAAPELADLPDLAPDLESLGARLDRAESDRSRAAERLTLATNAHETVADLAVRHGRTAVELADAERHADRYEAVAARCSGRTAPRVPLQRWVLATYLDEVCTHANRRLGAMTAGRYRLFVTRTPAKGNQPAGLDLRVHDANTNREREVSTLSGGETFQASLALALGVADSVEAHTGGVHLDALFIDEGFGSLDSDSLELALDELDGLRAAGRMVGVISHVGRLRERIRVGVEVHKGDAGSTVTVGEVPVL